MSEENSNIDAPSSFDRLNLDQRVYKAVCDLGFESPSKIQEQAIPVLLTGSDLIGQAQTGTGKTAAFALPLLSKLDVNLRAVQALILTPTRELAIQIAEACQSFAKYLEDFHILPIYGGASYDSQIRALNRGVQIVVGTPGRVMDLIRREKLNLSKLKTLVLDEADEMLNMGFIEDIEWIITQCPKKRQIALFSATMPDAIRKVATSYLHDPKEIRIASKTTTASTVRQRFWYVSGLHKIDAMVRLLEVEPYEAVLVFVKTKTDAETVSLKLSARGFSAEALHGDIPQKIREKIVDKLKNGRLDILVATDVAARGLDVDRITHVVNYDIPYDVESYVHRIGRTGRAGRTGDAILFVSPRDRKMLRIIEQTTRQKIEPMLMPSNEDINRHRVNAFKRRIMDRLEEARDDLDDFRELVGELLSDETVDPVELCTVLARMANNDEPLVRDEDEEEPVQKELRDDRSERRNEPKEISDKAVPLKDFPDIEMCRYRLSVGHCDGVKPGQIVGAIANEGDIDSCYIGQIDIYGTFSTVDLPVVPDHVRAVLQKTRVCGRCLELREFTKDNPGKGGRARGKPFSAEKKTPGKRKLSSRSGDFEHTGRRRKSR
jgi:ATP-dependent RNA helicase DeaD